MKNSPVSLYTLCAFAGISFAIACQSPTRPQPAADTPAAVNQEGNEYLDAMAEVVTAFDAARSDTALSKMIGSGGENQVKLLTREAPLLFGDFNADNAEDIIAAYSVVTPQDEKLNYAVFQRDSGKLRLVHVVPRGTSESKSILTFHHIDENGIIQGNEAELEKGLIWDVRYKWQGSALEEVSRMPQPAAPGS